ncbi:hypothetical protein GY21_04350 [Cryobacterium roopkundense]|uniref:Uncharacterized protein n=1 Tax=Cryobacterium roopkundense TaxID=1001240 RepID=A0A099JQH4_9MICO|nr:hypothetical protein [Cryobacterium roopkundense]KGJ79663.1 hypothetical protein GY21_04350 [Cryobacterium roopkundense]MBB5642505.1 hypothetical protein [Cryobacterium roopkundense]
MSAPDATQQRLDPIGGLAAWPLAPVTALIVVAYAVFSTLTQSGEVQNELFTALGVVAMSLAAGVLVWAALPESAPFERRSTVLMVSLALLGYVFEQLGMWGHNESVHNDFGQIGLGLLIMALAPFRPWREMVAVALGATLVVAFGALAQADSLGGATPPAIFAILAAVQLLAPALAGAAYCRQVVKAIRIWQTDAQRSIHLHTEESRAATSRAVVQQRMASLNASVLPFLDEILARGTVTAADIERARSLAEQVRQSLVAETDHTWLDDLLARERSALAVADGRPALTLPAADDPDRRAARFSARERAALGALLVMLFGQPGFDPAALSLRLSGRQSEGAEAESFTTVALEASVALSPYRLRRLVHPFVAVLRVEFGQVRVTVRGQTLDMRMDSGSAGGRPTLAAAATRNEY